eukprot:gene24322-29402_t
MTDMDDSSIKKENSSLLSATSPIKLLSKPAKQKKAAGKQQDLLKLETVPLNDIRRSIPRIFATMMNRGQTEDILHRLKSICDANQFVFVLTHIPSSQKSNTTPGEALSALSPRLASLDQEDQACPQSLKAPSSDSLRSVGESLPTVTNTTNNTRNPLNNTNNTPNTGNSMNNDSPLCPSSITYREIHGIHATSQYLGMFFTCVPDGIYICKDTQHYRGSSSSCGSGGGGRGSNSQIHCAYEFTGSVVYEMRVDNGVLTTHSNNLSPTHNNNNNNHLHDTSNNGQRDLYTPVPGHAHGKKRPSPAHGKHPSTSTSNNNTNTSTCASTMATIGTMHVSKMPSDEEKSVLSSGLEDSTASTRSMSHSTSMANVNITLEDALGGLAALAHAAEVYGSHMPVHTPAAATAGVPPHTTPHTTPHTSSYIPPHTSPHTTTTTPPHTAPHTIPPHTKSTNIPPPLVLPSKKRRKPDPASQCNNNNSSSTDLSPRSTEITLGYEKFTVRTRIPLSPSPTPSPTHYTLLCSAGTTFSPGDVLVPAPRPLHWRGVVVFSLTPQKRVSRIEMRFSEVAEDGRTADGQTGEDTSSPRNLSSPSDTQSSASEEGPGAYAQAPLPAAEHASSSGTSSSIYQYIDAHSAHTTQHSVYTHLALNYLNSHAMLQEEAEAEEEEAEGDEEGDEEGGDGVGKE